MGHYIWSPAQPSPSCFIVPINTKLWKLGLFEFGASTSRHSLVLVAMVTRKLPASQLHGFHCSQFLYTQSMFDFCSWIHLSHTITAFSSVLFVLTLSIFLLNLSVFLRRRRFLGTLSINRRECIEETTSVFIFWLECADYVFAL